MGNPKWLKDEPHNLLAKEKLLGKVIEFRHRPTPDKTTTFFSSTATVHSQSQAVKGILKESGYTLEELYFSLEELSPYIRIILK